MNKNFLQKIIDKIFEIQDIFLQKKYGKSLNYSDNSMVKSVMAQGVSLDLSSKLEDLRKEIYENVKTIAKENVNDLQNLLKIIKNEGFKIYILKNSNVLLKPIKEHEGFIPPKKGLSALYLNFLTTKNFSFKTEGLFIFENEKLSPYTLLYNFYMWYSYKTGLPGFGEENLQIKNLENLEKEENVQNLKYEDIMKLKQALNRERDAMKFTVEFMKETEGSKFAYEKLKNEEGTNL